MFILCITGLQFTSMAPTPLSNLDQLMVPYNFASWPQNLKMGWWLQSTLRPCWQAGFGRSGVCAAIFAIHKYDLPGESLVQTGGGGGRSNKLVSGFMGPIVVSGI